MLDKFFNPRSIAIIGASREAGKVGNSILSNLINHGYKGLIYPVNPRASEVMGLKCYPDILSLPDGVDLAVIVIPARLVPQAITDCGRKRISAAIVISAGFKEIGPEGRELESLLFSAAVSSGVRVLGPNCLGLINTANNMDCSFAAHYPEKGDIAIISQSGALCTAMLDWSARSHIGFSKVISIGNKVDIDEETLIEALADDADTRVITGYLEDISKGHHFMRTAERVTRIKPVILIKAGTTSAGAKAASSHTGSIAGTNVAYECAFRRSGVIQASSIESLFDYAQIFSYQPLLRGKRIAVVTNAGGPGIMAMDAIENVGLVCAAISDKTVSRLKEFLPPNANFHNPIDMIGDAKAETYGMTLEVILQDDGIDGVMVLLTPQAMIDPVEAAKNIVEATKGCNKPVVASFIGGEKVKEGIELLQKNKIPHYPTPERAVGALSVLADYVKWLEKPRRVVKRFAVNTTKVDRVLNLNRKRGITNISEYDSKAILASYGFQVPRGKVVKSPEEAAEAASEIGFPVVMKIISPDIIHKSDVGGVRTNIRSYQEVIDTYELMMIRVRNRCANARLQGIFVQEMVEDGWEVILGMTRDPQFGPMLMFGLGGIYVEVLRDVSFQLAPISSDEAVEMLVGTKTYNLLRGVRGEKPVDIQLVAECVQRLSQLSVDFPVIQEMDINPLKVSAARSRAVAVDARIRISLPVENT